MSDTGFDAVNSVAALFGQGGSAGTSPTPTQATVAQATNAQNPTPDNGPKLPTSDQIASSTQLATQRAQAADDAVTSFLNVSKNVESQRTGDLADTVTAKTAVNDQIQQETQNVQSKITPIFQRREAIANRQAELAGMNLSSVRSSRRLVWVTTRRGSMSRIRRRLGSSRSTARTMGS
jgi:hypothetical protein